MGAEEEHRFREGQRRSTQSDGGRGGAPSQTGAEDKHPVRERQRMTRRSYKTMTQSRTKGPLLFTASNLLYLLELSEVIKICPSLITTKHLVLITKESHTYPGNSVSTMFSNWSISWRIPGGSSGAEILLFPPSSQVPSTSSSWSISWRIPGGSSGAGLLLIPPPISSLIVMPFVRRLMTYRLNYHCRKLKTINSEKNYS